MPHQIYASFSLVGGPDTRTLHWQFIPFDPFLPDGMLWVVLPHKNHLSGRDVVSLLDVQERSGEACLTHRSKRSNMSLKVPGRAGAGTDMAERQPIPIPDPQHSPHEGGNGSPGLPPTVHERATPPESTLNRAVERTRTLYERYEWVFLPLGDHGKPSVNLPVNIKDQSDPLSEKTGQERQKNDILSEGELEKRPPKFVEQRREDETMPRIVIKTPEEQPHTSEETLSQERERQEIEASLDSLRQLRTMHQKITYVQDLPPEQLDKLREHEPALMSPIRKGLEKRPARLEKAARLLYRITEGDMSPARKPDYSLLIDKDAEWHRTHHADLMKLSQKDRDRLMYTEIELSIAMTGAFVEGISELAAIQNSLVCTHDYMRAFHEAGLEVPKVVSQIHRRLEKRRAYLDPKYAKGSGL